MVVGEFFCFIGGGTGDGVGGMGERNFENMNMTVPSTGARPKKQAYKGSKQLLSHQQEPAVR